MMNLNQKRSKATHMLLKGRTVCSADQRYNIEELNTTLSYRMTTCRRCNKKYAEKVKENE